MPIKYKTGDIFESKAQALINPVNCVGVMGKGLALQFKEKFPENFNFYKDHCDKKQLVPGRLLFVQEGKQWIINFPTKRHWKDSSKLEDIELGLKLLAVQIEPRKIKSLAIPALGCGLGGLPWESVKELIETHLSTVNCKISVYPPE